MGGGAQVKQVLIFCLVIGGLAVAVAVLTGLFVDYIAPTWKASPPILMGALAGVLTSVVVEKLEKEREARDSRVHQPSTEEIGEVLKLDFQRDPRLREE